MANSNPTPKLTKAKKFEMLKAIPAVAENKMLVEFIDHEIELLTKKNSGEKKLTATQVANEALKVAILQGMVAGTQYTVTDVIKSVPACAGLNNQKVSPLMNALVDEGKLVKTTEKRRSYFALPSAPAEV